MIIEIQKDPSSKELQTHNLPTDGVENINSTNKEYIYYSLTSRSLFPEEQKECRKGSWSTATLLYIDEHIINESKTRRKNSYDLDWLQKGIWYGS